MPFCPNSSLFLKNNAPVSEARDSEISNIWLCLFLRNASILNKMPILGQAPRPPGSLFCTHTKCLVVDDINTNKYCRRCGGAGYDRI